MRVQGLVESVLELMGLQEQGMGEKSTLADVGMDSLQMVEIRTKISTAIGRPLPLEQVSVSSPASPAGTGCEQCSGLQNTHHAPLQKP